jgi:uncharacterized membrane protein
MLQTSLRPLLGHADSHGRALTKAVSWRAIGTADTFLWAWLITHEPASAGAIASLETVTKIILYYLHERLWRLLRWSPNAKRRSLIKAISWRAVGSLDTFILSMLVTGNAGYAISIVSIEALTKVGLYYAHERLWRRVRWGRLETPTHEAPPAPAPASLEHSVP